jgi:glutathione S-transferase
MITAYTANTPNGVKLTIALAELGLERGSDYTLKILNLSEGEQKRPDFLAVNPNGRIPAIVHHVEGRDIRVFESGAVLLYLAENFAGNFKRLLSTDAAARIEAIGWTYFQTGGIGPNMGQAGYTKRQNETAMFERFNAESHRLVSVMEGALSDQDYLAGDYSIADIMNFGWLNRAEGYFDFDLEPYPNVGAWLARINARDGVKAGLAAFD